MQTDRINLSDDERAFARRRPDRTVYVAVIEFRGPRGRKYRPMRTAAQLDEVYAEREATKIRTRPYAHGAFPTTTTILALDALGNVKEQVTL